MTRSLLLLLLLLLAVIPAPAQTPPDPFQAHLQAGRTALRAGLPLLAAREYRAAVRLRPADADAHYALAGVLEAAGRADEAMAEYGRTVALRPDNAPAHNALAGLLEDRGERAAALAQYRQAIALLPSDPHLRFNLAGALADAGQRAQAAAQYREALRLKPDFAEAAQALRALAPLPPTREKPPALKPSGSASAGPGYSRMEVAPRLRMEVAPQLRRAGSNPSRPTPPPSTVLGAGGLSLARAGRLPEAVAAFRAVLVHHPRDAAARLHLGIALYADGQKALARREWGQVLTLGDPAATAQARRLLTQYP